MNDFWKIKIPISINHFARWSCLSKKETKQIALRRTPTCGGNFVECSLSLGGSQMSFRCNLVAHPFHSFPPQPPICWWLSEGADTSHAPLKWNGESPNHIYCHLERDELFQISVNFQQFSKFGSFTPETLIFRKTILKEVWLMYTYRYTKSVLLFLYKLIIYK